MRSTEKVNWGERLRVVRQKMGLTQRMIGSVMGLDRAWISQLENGRQAFTEENKEKVAALEKLHAEGKAPDATEHINTLKTLTEQEKLTFHETAPIWKVTEARHRVVPVVSYARAGEGINPDDLAGQFDEYVTTESRDANAFAMVVEGDSMEPEFREGDRVVIEPNSEPRNGDVVLARVLESGNVYLKKFKRTGKNGERVLLTSHNELYQDIEMERSKFRFIYPVVERKLRR